jgi:predicted GH43/DUF377 family glycosyl hydrolase
MLKRYLHNPILTPDPNNKLYSKKVYNSAVVKHDGVYYMLFRGVGDDWISRIFLATSKNGLDFEVIPEPVIFPEASWESKGCEDPRVTRIGSKFWMSYTAYDGVTARSAIATSSNIYDWQKHGLIFPQLANPQREDLPEEWHKSAAIFPEKFKNKFLLLFGDNHIWPATSEDSINWIPSATPLISAREGFFDAAYVEMGPPPIKTENGWLVLYHGIDTFDNKRAYRLGAVLLSIDNPFNVIWRSETPILEPTEVYERVGLIDLLPGGYSSLKTMTNADLKDLADKHELPRAVFCCGAIKEDNTIRIYYGAGDTRICTASVDLSTIFSSS